MPCALNQALENEMHYFHADLLLLLHDGLHLPGPPGPVGRQRPVVADQEALVPDHPDAVTDEEDPNAVTEIDQAHLEQKKITRLTEAFHGRFGENRVRNNDRKGLVRYSNP